MYSFAPDFILAYVVLSDQMLSDAGQMLISGLGGAEQIKRLISVCEYESGVTLNMMPLSFRLRGLFHFRLPV